MIVSNVSQYDSVSMRVNALSILHSFIYKVQLFSRYFMFFVTRLTIFSLILMEELPLERLEFAQYCVVTVCETAICNVIMYALQLMKNIVSEKRALRLV